MSREDVRLEEMLSGVTVTAEKGAVHYWAAFFPERVAQVERLVRERFDGPGFCAVDLETLAWRPWAPFVDLTADAPGPRTYFRHRHLFSGDEAPPEPLAEEELPYELGRLADSLLDRLVSRATPAVVFVRHAELLSHEAFFLAERFRERLDRPLLLLFCFETRPREAGTFEHLDTLGYLTWLDAPPLTALPGPFPAKAFPDPSSAQRRQLMRWLCFQTLAHSRGEEGGVERLEAMAVIGGFEEGIELGEALLRRATDVELGRLWTSLALLYRQAGDPASAARYLTLGWKQARDAGNREALARFDYLLFETSYRTLVVEDVYLGLEDRLTESLEQLGWFNHLSHVFSKNVWVQTVGRTRGWDEARRMLERGRRMIQSLGNQRRRGVALQTLGSLLAIGGDLPAALKATRRAVLLARKHSTPLHTAKVENGLGYLYFSAGEYRRAWLHHSMALQRLPETRDHQEYIGTLVNLGRLYLFNDQADRALPLLTTAVRAMDGLNLSDMAFHPRSNTLALLGACCLKTGQTGRALEFLKKIKAEEERTKWVNEHRVCLEALSAATLGQTARAAELMDEVFKLLGPRLADLRHLLIWVLLEQSRLSSSDSTREALWKRAEAALHPAPFSRDERRHLNALRTSRPRPSLLPPVNWDSPLLIRFSRQEAALRGLRRTVQDYGFLQTWHQELLPGLEEDELFQRAVSLIRTHFPLDSVAMMDGTLPRILALAPGSQSSLILLAAEKGHPDPEAGLTVAAVFPLIHSGGVQARLVCVDGHPEPLFGPGDARVLDLAADHLSVLLLSQRKAQDLEERGAHLARALEVLRDTQERLVRSENLAVLGNLSAGLAHELNTPLGAILSASQTVQELLSGPLSVLWDEALAWPGRERDVFRMLVTRLVGREADLSTDRQGRRTLRQKLESEGRPDAGVLADLWYETGLGNDTDLQQALRAEPQMAAILERLIPLAQGHRLGRVIQESAHRAGAVVGSLRSYLQGSSAEDDSTFGLRGEFEAVLAVLGAPRWKAIRIAWDMEPDLRLSGRRLSLAQVWTNLVQNAAQAMEGKGQLQISARVGVEVVIEVCDNGPGIPEAHQEQILQPFFSTKKQTGGLGLGLDICRRIVEAHEGHLEFESRPGRTVFRVRLPAGLVVNPSTSVGS